MRERKKEQQVIEILIDLTTRVAELTQIHTKL